MKDKFNEKRIKTMEKRVATAKTSFAKKALTKIMNNMKNNGR